MIELRDAQPSGTVLIPAYNEGKIVAESLRRVAAVLETAGPDFRWEIIVVDDGSEDDTFHLASAAAFDYAERGIDIRVLRHLTNAGLGGALQTGFAASRGDVVVVIDCDLSYHPAHIPVLVDALGTTGAQIVVASPYMVGGRTLNVPAGVERRSRLANTFLSTFSNSHVATLTGMVRAYDGPFVRSLALKSMNDGINVEILYKAHVLRARIVEVPATLDWNGLEQRCSNSRLINRRTRAKTYHMLVHGLLFRPYLAFLLGVGSLWGLGGLSGLIALFKPGAQLGLTLLGVGMIGAGILVLFMGVASLQVKRSFEETYFLISKDRVHMNRVVGGLVATAVPEPWRGSSTDRPVSALRKAALGEGASELARSTPPVGKTPAIGKVSARAMKTSAIGSESSAAAMSAESGWVQQP